MRTFAIILALILFSNLVFAQSDTEFWFAAPEVSIHNQNFDRPVILRVTSTGLASTLTISQPANGTFTPIVVNLAAGGSQSIDLTPWIDQIENRPPDQVLNNGLLITATEPITAYYEVVSTQCACNPEIFALKGDNGLGVDFFIPMQNFLDNSPVYNPDAYSSFDIVATQNNTTVSITPTNPVVGHAAGTLYTIVLNAGQTYSATATGQLAAQHLHGSRVISDKPIAITMKDDLLNGAPFGGCADIGGDQIIPTTNIGNEYIVNRGFLNAPYDQVFILATQNGTSIDINGAPVTTLNSGQTYNYAMGNVNSAYINASAPVYVLQLSGFGCEVGLSILPPILCTGSQSVAFTRSNNETLFITLLVQSGSEGDFLLNGAGGVINAGQFTTVPGTNGQWMSAQIELTTAQAAAGVASVVSNNSNFFHMGMIHGSAGGGCRFGFFSDFNTFDVEALASASDVCIGDSILLNAQTSFGATYDWSGPNNFTANNQNPFVVDAQNINAGDYIVIADVGGCLSDPDTTNVQVRPSYRDTVNATICEGDSFTLPDGNSVFAAGWHTVSLSSAFGCDSIIDTELDYYFIDTSYTSDQFCEGDTYTFPDGSTSALEGVYPIVLTDNQTSCDSVVIFDLEYFSIDTNNITALFCVDSTYTFPDGSSTANPGTHVIVFTDNQTNCDSVVIFELERSEPELEIQKEDISCYGFSDGTVDLTANFGIAPYSFLLDGSAAQSGTSISFNNLTSGVYSVLLEDSLGCTVQDSFEIIEPDSLLISLTSEDISCFGANDGSAEASVSGGTPEYIYSWSSGGNGSNISSLNAGINTLTVTDANACSKEIQFEITEPEEIIIDLPASYEIRIGEEVELQAASNNSIASWQWTPEDGLNCSDCSEPIANPFADTEYFLTATDTANCIGEAVTFVSVLPDKSFYVPNAFSPNGDGLNDVFYVYAKAVKGFSLRIFDQWGTELFASTDISEGWDGTYKGKVLEPGVFAYSVGLTYLDNEQVRKKGSLTLIK